MSCPPGPLWYHEAIQLNQKTNLFLSQDSERKLSKLVTQLFSQQALSCREAQAACRWAHQLYLRPFRRVGWAEVTCLVENASLTSLIHDGQHTPSLGFCCSFFILTLHSCRAMQTLTFHRGALIWLKRCSLSLFHFVCRPSCRYCRLFPSNFEDGWSRRGSLLMKPYLQGRAFITHRRHFTWHGWSQMKEPIINHVIMFWKDSVKAAHNNLICIILFFITLQYSRFNPAAPHHRRKSVRVDDILYLFFVTATTFLTILLISEPDAAVPQSLYTVAQDDVVITSHNKNPYCFLCVCWVTWNCIDHTDTHSSRHPGNGQWAQSKSCASGQSKVFVSTFVLNHFCICCRLVITAVILTFGDMLRSHKK